MELLGIDIGGTGIKGAPVDIEKGSLVGERFRLATPQPATAQGVAETAAAVAAHFSWKGPIGFGFPAVIRQGVVHTAANIDAEWLGVNAQELLAKTTGCPTRVANDADVAGMAEMRYGAGRDHEGVVLIATLGTGIGTALFNEGKLVPNTELGHIELGGREAEKWAAESVRERKDLSWKKWGHRVETFLKAMEAYLWPELIIIGGGVSKKHAKFFPHIQLDTPVVAAQLFNQAGIVGAALAAEGLV